MVLAARCKDIFGFYLEYGRILPEFPCVKRPRKTNICMTVHVAALLMYQFLSGEQRRPHTMKKSNKCGHLGSMITEATKDFYAPLIQFFVEFVLRGSFEREIQEHGHLMFDDDSKDVMDFAAKMTDKNLFKWMHRQKHKLNQFGWWTVSTASENSIQGLYLPHYETLKLACPDF
jgi:hypothetical protein